jgi:hypothetical protein
MREAQTGYMASPEGQWKVRAKANVRAGWMLTVLLCSHPDPSAGGASLGAQGVSTHLCPIVD